MSSMENQTDDVEIRIRKEKTGYMVSGIYMNVATQIAIADLSELESAISKIKQAGVNSKSC